MRQRPENAMIPSVRVCEQVPLFSHSLFSVLAARASWSILGLSLFSFRQVLSLSRR